jgi:hypothetical protein
MGLRALRRRYGHFASAEGSAIQSLLFPRPKFSVKTAKAWAARHGWKTGDVDVKEKFIHLRQTDPSQYKNIRSQYLGGSGVMARLGWH